MNWNRRCTRLRVLLTGIHLMRTGEVVADLRLLWAGHGVDYVPDLIAAKAAGEHRALSADPDLPAPAVLARMSPGCAANWSWSGTGTVLPDRPRSTDALHDLVVRARLG